MTETVAFAPLAPGLSVDPNFVFQVIRQYGEPHRKFHTSEHLRHLFLTLERFYNYRLKMEGDYYQIDLDLMFLCICIHDWFYTPGDPMNEEDSAAMVDLLIPDYPRKEWVREIILATKTHTHIPVVDEFTFHRALMIDLDLSGLGSDFESYIHTDKQVADEFIPVVGEEAYNAGRPKWCQSMLDREQIFSISWFKDNFEAQARENLQDTVIHYSDKEFDI